MTPFIYPEHNSCIFVLKFIGEKNLSKLVIPVNFITLKNCQEPVISLNEHEGKQDLYWELAVRKL